MASQNGHTQFKNKVLIIIILKSVGRFTFVSFPTSSTFGGDFSWVSVEGIVTLTIFANVHEKEKLRTNNSAIFWLGLLFE